MIRGYTINDALGNSYDLDGNMSIKEWGSFELYKDGQKCLDIAANLARTHGQTFKVFSYHSETSRGMGETVSEVDCFRGFYTR